MIGLTILLRVFKAVPTANISFYLNNTKMHNINHSERLPYEKLAALGIDREKADSLPQEVKEKLASGEVTPLMQVSISARNGDIITLPLKLQLTTDQQGNPALMAYPVRAVLEKERNQVLRLVDQEAERLSKGEDIQKAGGLYGRHERVGTTAETPLRRTASRVPGTGDDGQEPLGIPAGGGRAVTGKSLETPCSES